MLILSEEVNDILASKATLIKFFALPEEQQIQIIPVLDEERKYDFPDGDLITDNALEILVNEYKASLNSILIWLDEPHNDNIQGLFKVFEQIFEIINFIENHYNEDTDNSTIFKLPEWSKLRELSSVVQKTLNIQQAPNTNILKSYIEYRLHP
ncbi:hypothetical protein [Rivularia sp. UHCC 0363]|uniref:hypothetical protein n=1 Tax=Rivularia sp. UHCC 0363 TaxID=3110244 RepID=UPI002B20CF34|nr:hypothetical protein [Rivularia sp. UHCC 0363]MEA5595597.1 hypothetical protein [Rivularia sp. UHCC 0363]